MIDSTQNPPLYKLLPIDVKENEVQNCCSENQRIVKVSIRHLYAKIMEGGKPSYEANYVYPWPEKRFFVINFPYQEFNNEHGKGIQELLLQEHQLQINQFCETHKLKLLDFNLCFDLDKAEDKLDYSKLVVYLLTDPITKKD